MSVDMAQVEAIHRIQGEVNAAERTYKELGEKCADVIGDLPEYQVLQDALVAVRDASRALKLAIRSNGALADLEEERADAAYRRRDLREILSHHLVAYHEDTGRDVVKDRDARTRQIELRAKLGKPTLDQARLPLGLGRHFGVHQEISTALPVHRIEVEADQVIKQGTK